jgi:hypothetical protein
VTSGPVRRARMYLAPGDAVPGELAAALKIELPVVWESIKAIVKEGHVGLEGTVE